MKNLYKSSFQTLVFLIFAGLLVTSSCGKFDFREKCKGEKEVHKEMLFKALIWTDTQRGTFYSGISNGEVEFFLNSSIYQLACTENPVTAKVRLRINAEDYHYKAKFSMVVTTTAEAQIIEEIALELDPDYPNDSYKAFVGELEIGFNNPNREDLYGSVNVQTLVTRPLPSYFVDNPEDRSFHIREIESLVEQIDVEIHYTY